MPFPSHPFKICSQCQTPAEPDAPLCEQCGRVFSAQSSAALAPPPPLYGSSDAPRKSSARRAMIVTGVAGVAILSYMGYHSQMDAPDHMETTFVPAQHKVMAVQHSAALAPHTSATHTSAKRSAPKDMAPNPQFHH